MSPQKNKDIIQRFYEKLGSRVPNVLNEFISDDYVCHSVWKDQEGLERAITALWAAYPGLKNQIDDLIAEADKIVVRGRIIAPQKLISYISVFRVRNDKIVEQWAHSDSFF